MRIKSIHYFSGIVISVFVAFHLLNHASSVFGAEQHIAVMELFRVVYRNVFVETLLLAAVLVQIITGLWLFNKGRKWATTFFEKLQIWSGLYLAIFFVIHLSAVLGGRLVLHLDTNFYFGVAGLNTFPFNLFFIPYYGLAVLSFFGHIAAIHQRKMKPSVLGLSPTAQSKFMLGFGLLFTLFLFYGLTNHFQSVEIPAAYGVLVGK
ncbi:MAG: hypothetical protein JNL95_10465 [Chitinophagales bacterium]|nr:hypothetical protein [Chitinophagales bacterium]